MRPDEAGEGLIRVYGDIAHTVFLGKVESPQKAMALLDGYDSQLTRRQKIADLIDNTNKSVKNND